MSETTWQERVGAEAYELRQKLDYLNWFLSNEKKVAGISEEMFRLMRAQRESMKEYLENLDMRLELAEFEAIEEAKRTKTEVTHVGVSEEAAGCCSEVRGVAEPDGTVTRKECCARGGE